MPSTTRKRQPRMPIEARRDQILDAALQLIAEHGYAAASMEAIARTANIAKPRVYAAYPDRGQLIRALLEREEQHAIAALAEAMPPLSDDIDLPTTLATAAENLLNTVTEHPAAWRLLTLPTDEAPPEAREHYATARRFALSQLLMLLETGRASHPWLADLDLELAAHALLAIGEQTIRLILTNSTEFTPQRFANFARTLLRALPGAAPV